MENGTRLVLFQSPSLAKFFNYGTEFYRKDTLFHGAQIYELNTVQQD